LTPVLLRPILGIAMSRILHATKSNGWPCLLMLFLLVAWSPAQAAERDEFLNVISLIGEADSLSQRGRDEQALAKYREAYTALIQLRRKYPRWEPQMLNYRLNYLEGKLAAAAPPEVKEDGHPKASAQRKPAAAGDQFKLIEPGSEPRQALRFQPKPGDTQAMTMTIRMSLGIKMGGNSMPETKVPQMKMTLNTTVKDVSDSGDITFEVVLADTEIAGGDDTATAMSQALEGIKGLSTTSTMTSRGVVKTMETKGQGATSSTPGQGMDQFNEMLMQMVAQLPEEPVGAGARWQVIAKTKSQGMALDQTATFELVALDGNKAKIKSTLSQSAPKQKVENPMMPGMKVDLTKFTGKGTGEMTLDFTRMLPVSGTAKAHNETVMSMAMGNQRQAMATVIDMDMRLESK
jgi:hypothetical protein